MNLKSSKQQAGAGESTPPRNPWRVSRLDVRSPLSRDAGYVARVELTHEQRGRVSDTARGTDVLGAAIAAVQHLLGSNATVHSLRSGQRSYSADAACPSVHAAIVIDCEGRKGRGSASGDDLVHACLAAFIEAVTSGTDREYSPLASGLNLDSDIELLAQRPCQVSGIDENGDWWLFASDDAGAAEAIAAEFADDAFRTVQLSIPPNGCSD